MVLGLLFKVTGLDGRKCPRLYRLAGVQHGLVGHRDGDVVVVVVDANAEGGAESVVGGVAVTDGHAGAAGRWARVRVLGMEGTFQNTALHFSTTDHQSPSSRVNFKQ